MTMTDKESVAQLLKEMIIQLCKANVFYSGQVEIDGIICISGQIEGQELVIKVHEIFATPQDLRNPYAAIRYQPIGAKFSDFQSLYGDFQRQELKRKRLDSGFDFRPSLAYSYLSKLVYEQNQPKSFAESNLDQRNNATDLSIKSSLANSNHRLDLRSERSPSPQQGLERKYDINDETFPAALLGIKTVPSMDGWSPSKSFSSLPQCRLCACSFDSSEALSDHNETVHSVFTCLCCFKTFTSRSNLERHSRLHTGHRPYSCDFCGKSFSRKDHLSNHATKHAFKCGTCSQRCPDKGALISHYLYDHGATLTNVCGFCNKGFCGSELYEEHMKSHPQMNSSDGGKSNSEPAGSQAVSRSLSRERYFCMNCSFETNDKVSLAKHELVHSAKQQLYTCMGCGKIYEDPLQYSDHLILHQKDRDIFECCMCRHVCTTLSSLRRHEATHISDDNSDMEIVAEDDRFRCGECGRTFDTLAILQEHLEVHLLVKQHKHACNSCRKTFESQADLESHVEETEGQCGGGVPEEGSNFAEDCSGAADGASRRDKRKQKQPKPAVNVGGEMGECGGSDVEVADLVLRDDHKSRDFVITNNPACVIQVSADVEIKMEPVKSILNRTTGTASSKPRRDLARPGDRDIPPLMSLKMEGSEDDVDGKVKAGNLETPVRPTAKPRGRGRGRRHHGSAEKTSRLHGLVENHVSPNGSLCGDVTMNNNLISMRNENHPFGADAPPGPFTCVFCSFEADTFQLLDNHCATLHSRSPCMFCSKTFAQKANRDRHHCLHTGDKPYGCPECDEKFSRGDKLKMHRVRAHGVQYPLYSSRHKESSAQEREFANSPSGFLALQSDGYASLPPVYLAGLPALAVFENHDPDEVADVRMSGAVARGNADEVNDHEEYPRTDTGLTKSWNVEKKGSIRWEKRQSCGSETDAENKIMERVSVSN